MQIFRIVFAAVAVAVAGCAIERAQVAGEAQQKMIGLTKEQVLTCMGPPATKAAEGATEVWSYNSGNDHTQIATFGQSTTTASLTGIGTSLRATHIRWAPASGYRVGGIVR